MHTWIGLLDCNNFFVSCERLFRPDLSQKPVMVLSSNDGCVVARSQEVKDSGIPMGIPVFQIKDIIKDKGITCFSSHFALYRDISRRVFASMESELGEIEQYSIDEAFFIFKGTKEEFLERMKHLKDKIEREAGIPVSVAGSLSKTLAKLANSRAKKTKSVFVLDLENLNSLSCDIKLSELWGVGSKTAKHFAEHRLITVADLLKADKGRVQQLFGINGVRLFEELSGVASIAYRPIAREQKSLLHSRSFKSTTNDIDVLHDAVSYHVREAVAELRHMSLKASFFQVTIATSRHGDFFLHGGSAFVELVEPSNDTFVFLKEATQLVESLYKQGVPYKKAGILLSNFTPETVTQLSMFKTDTKQSTEVMKALDEINATKGKGTLVIGSHLKTEKWQSLHESQSPAYTTSWSDIAIVHATE
jgi:DNA polymerase V